MQFLEKFRTWFARLLGAESSKPYISSTGAVARFVFERSKIRHDGSPKPGIFEPERHPDTGTLETSICGLNGVSNERLWLLGRTVRSDKQAIAAVEIGIDKVNAAGLDCRAEATDNFPEHGVIVGWSDEKSVRMLTQQQLVVSLTRMLHPKA
jgi:hypothetical protein